jgi:hypothetical protein
VRSLRAVSISASVAHPAIAGLVLDIVGAAIIAVTVLVARPAKWVADARASGTMAAMQGVFPIRDREHAQQVADTRIGASLLALGFAGQLGAGLMDKWPARSALWAYPTAFVIICLAMLYRDAVRRAVERDIYLERMRQGDTNDRLTTDEMYRDAYKNDPDALREIDRWNAAAERGSARSGRQGHGRRGPCPWSTRPPRGPRQPPRCRTASRSSSLPRPRGRATAGSAPAGRRLGARHRERVLYAVDLADRADPGALLGGVVALAELAGVDSPARGGRRSHCGSSATPTARLSVPPPRSPWHASRAARTASPARSRTPLASTSTATNRRRRTTGRATASPSTPIAATPRSSGSAAVAPPSPRSQRTSRGVSGGGVLDLDGNQVIVGERT